MHRNALVSFLLILSSLAGYSDRATPDKTKTQIALPLATPPTIDGKIESAEWGLAGGAAGNFWVVRPDANLEDGIRGGGPGDTGSPPVSNEDLSFNVFVGYDSDNLYVAVRVRDDVLMEDSAEAASRNGNTWLDDGVEVFVDGDNSNLETRDTTGTNPEVVKTGGQYVITVNNAYREAEAGNPGYGSTAAWYAKTARTADASGTEVGYEAEFRISLKTLGSPKPGDFIGFTVAVNDDDDGGNNDRQVIWVGKPHTEALYGNLLLGGRSYEAPKTKAPTIDGLIRPEEYAGANVIKIDPYTAIYDIPSGDDTFEPTDHGYSAWVVHDAEAIYVAMDVIDDKVVNDTADAGSEDGTTWEDDSVEIFFDANHSHDAGRGSGQFEGQFVFTANGAWRDNEANNPQFGATGDWFGATSKTAGGYQVEFKIKKSALFNPDDGSVIGFHIAQNDDDGSGRKAQPGWSGRAHSEFTYGHLTLLAPAGTTPPKLVFSRSGRELTLSWDGGGTLESAGSVTGPWAAVAGASTGYKVQATAASAFFRVRR
ncbi:MAG: hypothetical protein HY735_34025 [Verrucomicrobia bacterium]|nr:hypothetical protein [Verrucomicrobiota bacterium]